MELRIKGCWLVVGSLLFAGVARTEPGDDGDVESSFEARREMARMIGVSSDPRQRLLAAHLLATPPDYAALDPDDPDLIEARELFVVARVGSTDPWVLWTVGSHCPFDAATCDRDGAASQLARLQPDNAAAWLPAVDLAVQAGNAAAVDDALARMAGAKGWSDFYFDNVHVAFSAIDSISTSPRLVELLAGWAGVGIEAATKRREMLSATYAVTSAFDVLLPPLQSVATACRGEALDSRARRPDCRAIARHLMASNTLLSQRLGVSFARRLAQDDAERAEVDAFVRRLDWQSEAYSDVRRGFDVAGERELTTADLRTFRIWRDAWRHASSEDEVINAVLVAAGVPLEPPASYRSPDRAWPRSGDP
jgi:hypothetical protein